MKTIVSVLIVLMLMGCETLKDAEMVKTKVYDEEGKVIMTIESKSDAQVKVEKNETGVTKFEVDNRGKTSWWESLLQYVLSKPDINIGDRD